jgi:hypothetical protein
VVDVPNIDYGAQPANYDWLAEIGITLGAAGAVNNIVGTYYGLKAQQGAYRLEAMNAEFAANQSSIAARAAERDAENIIRAGQQEAGRRGFMAAREAASFRAETAARGVDVGTGSAGEMERAIRIAAEVDKRTIRTNAQMRASATREAAANQRAGSLLGRATAANLRASASSINPALGAVGAGLNSTSSLIGNYLSYRGRR